MTHLKPNGSRLDIRYPNVNTWTANEPFAMSPAWLQPNNRFLSCPPNAHPQPRFSHQSVCGPMRANSMLPLTDQRCRVPNTVWCNFESARPVFQRHQGVRGRFHLPNSNTMVNVGNHWECQPMASNVPGDNHINQYDNNNNDHACCSTSNSGKHFNETNRSCISSNIRGDRVIRTMTAGHFAGPEVQHNLKCDTQILSTNDNTGLQESKEKISISYRPPFYNQARQRHLKTVGGANLHYQGQSMAHVGKSKKRRKPCKKKRAEDMKFYCKVCDHGFNTNSNFMVHNDQHIKCPDDGCPYTASPQLTELHYAAQHVTGLAHKIWTEDDDLWRKERRRNFPRFEASSFRSTEEESRQRQPVRIGRQRQPVRIGRQRRKRHRTKTPGMTSASRVASDAASTGADGSHGSRAPTSYSSSSDGMQGNDEACFDFDTANRRSPVNNVDLECGHKSLKISDTCEDGVGKHLDAAVGAFLCNPGSDCHQATGLTSTAFKDVTSEGPLCPDTIIERSELAVAHCHSTDQYKAVCCTETDGGRGQAKSDAGVSSDCDDTEDGKTDFPIQCDVANAHSGQFDGHLSDGGDGDVVGFQDELVHANAILNDSVSSHVPITQTIGVSPQMPADKHKTVSNRVFSIEHHQFTSSGQQGITATDCTSSKPREQLEYIDETKGETMRRSCVDPCVSEKVSCDWMKRVRHGDVGVRGNIPLAMHKNHNKTARDDPQTGSLLEKLLEPEIRHECSVILQSVYWIVKNNFLGIKPWRVMS